MRTDTLSSRKTQAPGGAHNQQANQASAATWSAEAAPPLRPAAPPAPGIEAAQDELREFKDHYLWMAQAFDNFKKRTTLEAERRAAAQKEVFILELLPVIDCLDRALVNDGTTSREQLHRVVKLVTLQLLHFLRRHDVEPDDCLGQPFHPSRHEAIGIGRNATQPNQVVLEVSRRGWLRGKDVLRPAKVIVNDLNQTQSNGTSLSTRFEYDQNNQAQDNQTL